LNMPKSMKNRVKRLEKRSGTKGGLCLILMQPGETSEQARERYLAQHPQAGDASAFIIIQGPPSHDPCSPPPRPSTMGNREKDGDRQGGTSATQYAGPGPIMIFK
jgi:hypothetical protein